MLTRWARLRPKRSSGAVRVHVAHVAAGQQLAKATRCRAASPGRGRHRASLEPIDRPPVLTVVIESPHSARRAGCARRRWSSVQGSAPTMSWHARAAASCTESYARRPCSHAKASARSTNASVTGTLPKSGHSRRNLRCARRASSSSTRSSRTAFASAAATSVRVTSAVATAAASAIRAMTSSEPCSATAFDEGAGIQVEEGHPRFSTTMSLMLPPPRRRTSGFATPSRRPLQESAPVSFSMVSRCSSESVSGMMRATWRPWSVTTIVVAPASTSRMYSVASTSDREDRHAALA